MEYREARAFMEGIPGEIHLELDRIRALLQELNHPEQTLHTIHIAGTNGKGSILSYLSTALTHAGYRVGRYISPTLYSYLGRFQVNGVRMTEDTYVRLTEKIMLAADRLRERGIPCTSAFELETVLCFLWFQEEHCDLVVLECGMGGRLDATNVIPTPELTVFASISMDHMKFLGNSLAEIAAEKAGIIKEGTCVVSAPQEETVTAVLRGRCEEKQVPFLQVDLNRAEVLRNTLEGQRFRYRGTEIEIGLPGDCQLDNALTAYEGLKQLQRKGFDLTEEQILEGLRQTVWEGRFTCIAKDPCFIVDGAHNPAAAVRLRRSIETYFPDKRLIFVMGVLADKDYPAVVRETAHLASSVFTIAPPDNPRALPAEQLKEAILPVNRKVCACASLEEAVEQAYQTAGKEDVILAFGSLSFLGRLTELVKGAEYVRPE